MRRALFLAPVLVLAAVASTHAVTLKRMHIDEVIKHADAVVVGTVARQSCARDAARPKIIVTKVTLTNLTVLHGTHKGAELTLSFAGGRLGTERVLVPGMPTFKDGERVVLFVGLNRGWYCPVVGWHQGRFNIEKDKATGRMIVLDGRGKRVGGITSGRVVLRPGGKDDFGAEAFLAAVRGLIPKEEDEPDAGEGEDER
jgi:hypothetical protein